MRKLSICVLFGGPEGERQTSVRAAVSVLKRMDPEKYNVFPVCITTKGDWILYGGRDFDVLLQPDWMNLPECRRAAISPVRNQGLLTFEDDCVVRERIDVAFPLIRADFGAIQGLLDLAGIPFVGSDAAACALTADKALTKLMAEKLELQTAPWQQVKSCDVENHPQQVLQELEETLGYPLFIKSVQRLAEAKVCAACDRQQLLEALQEMCLWGEWVLVESAVEGWEVEVAVMGNSIPMASVCAEIDTAETSRAFIPARIPEEQEEAVREAAVKLYGALGCKGIGKLTFFVKYDNSGIVFESANAQPDFSESALVANLFAASGIPMEQLVDQLVELAMEEKE